MPPYSRAGEERGLCISACFTLEDKIQILYQDYIQHKIHTEAVLAFWQAYSSQTYQIYLCSCELTKKD